MSKSTKFLRACLALETLEDRVTPASFVNGAGDLVIVGNNANNNVSVNLQVFDGVVWYRVTENGVNKWFLASSVTGGDVYFYGYGGNDTFFNNTALRATAFGHAGCDVLIGGSRNDYLNGGAGRDYLNGREGNDTLIAGYDYSSNTLVGGDGDDLLIGGCARDYMYGSDGNDTMWGMSGNDYMRGGAGDDAMHGGAGRDTMYGDDGDDDLWGDAGNDYINGGAHVLGDWANGGLGFDIIVNVP